MARASTITRLPADILEQLQELLRDPRITQLNATAEINKILDEQGHEQVSKSAVNRYSMKMEEVGARLKQSREVAAMWIGKLGNAPQGQVGKLLNEIIRTLAFDTAMHLSEGEEPVAPKLLSQLAMAVRHLESAASMNEDVAIKARKQAAIDAAELAGKSLASQGMSQQGIDKIKQDILGIS